MSDNELIELVESSVRYVLIEGLLSVLSNLENQESQEGLQIVKAVIEMKMKNAIFYELVLTSACVLFLGWVDENEKAP